MDLQTLTQYASIPCGLVYNPVFRQRNLWQVLSLCLLRAASEPRIFVLNDGERVSVGRGEFIIGERTGGKLCDMNPSTFRRALLRLRELGFIDLVPLKKYTLVRVSQLDERNPELPQANPLSSEDNPHSISRDGTPLHGFILSSLCPGQVVEVSAQLTVTQADLRFTPLSGQIEHLLKKSICEVAFGEVTNRNIPCGAVQFPPPLSEPTQLFRSVYLFPESERWQNDSRHWADQIPFDFDAEGSASLEDVQREAIRFVLYLTEIFEVSPDFLEICFSGRRGFHVSIPVESFMPSVVPAEDFSENVKRVANQLSSGFRFIDGSIYHSRALLRATNSLHKKSGLFKVPLSFDELRNLSVPEIQEIAQEPRPGFSSLDRSELLPLPMLFEVWNHKGLRRKVQPAPGKDTNVAGVIALSKILNGVHRGERNSSAIRMAGLCIARGCEEEETLAFLKSWNYKNNPPLEEREIKRLVHNAFRRYGLLHIAGHSFGKTLTHDRNDYSEGK